MQFRGRGWIQTAWGGLAKATRWKSFIVCSPLTAFTSTLLSRDCDRDLAIFSFVLRTSQSFQWTGSSLNPLSFAMRRAVKEDTTLWYCGASKSFSLRVKKKKTARKSRLKQQEVINVFILLNSVFLIMIYLRCQYCTCICVDAQHLEAHGPVLPLRTIFFRTHVNILMRIRNNLHSQFKNFMQTA